MLIWIPYTYMCHCLEKNLKTINSFAPTQTLICVSKLLESSESLCRINDAFTHMNVLHLYCTSCLLQGCEYWWACSCQWTHLCNSPQDGFLRLALRGRLVAAWFFFWTPLPATAIRFHVGHAVYFPPRRRTTAFRRRMEWRWSRRRCTRALRSSDEVIIWLTVICRSSFRMRFQIGVPLL
jgi:hypothetical protein